MRVSYERAVPRDATCLPLAAACFWRYMLAQRNVGGSIAVKMDFAMGYSSDLA